MAGQIDPHTAQAVHNIVRIPAAIILAIFWIGIATPIFLIRFLAVMILNLFRMAVQNYETGNGAAPMRALVYFAALYPTITSKLFQSVWIWNESERLDGTQTGLNFWAELVFFGLTLLSFTAVNFWPEFSAGFFSQLGTRAALTGRGIDSWIVLGFAAMASVVIIILAFRSDIDSLMLKVLSGATVIFGGFLIYGALFGWPDFIG